MQYVLRPVTDADYAWLWNLKRTTMRPYVEQTWGGWDETAQEEFFREHFVPAKLRVIATQGDDAGLLHVEDEPGAVFLANIQILPLFQNRGLGTAVVRDLIRQTHGRGLPLRLQVLKTNPAARRLYERLGLVMTDLSGTHWQMRADVPRPVPTARFDPLTKR